MSLRLDLGIRLIPEITQIFESDAQFLLAEVRPLKYLRLEHFQLVASELRLPLLMLSNRLNDVFFDVLQESFDERSADLGDTTA